MFQFQYHEALLFAQKIAQVEERFTGEKTEEKHEHENGAASGAGTSEPVPIPQSKSSNIVHHVSHSNGDDYEAVCSSIGEESRKNFDAQLDKHMMQTITDVKYMIKHSKYTALSEVNFQRGCLDAHNECRQRYGNEHLCWSTELAEMAHAWAVKLAERGRMLYPELPGIGENIILKEANEQSHLPTGQEVIQEWEKEAQFFDFDKPRWNPKCQQFSQVVWKDTSELGAARYWNTANNCVAVVCFYRPAGNSNAPGEFASNVPSRDCSMSPIRNLGAQMKRHVTISTPERAVVSSPSRV
uniref:SCP domain-containing protein n=1 Tax=Caenorhabditis japonica TaxID=281687 RepID=A0A8R1I533_CAEJA